MKIIEGASLRKAAKSYVDAPRATARLMATIARAVDYAHRCGVVHRDLKPANVLIDSAGEPHVADFGLARRFTDPASLTMSTGIAGTPSYMAPEQASGTPVVTTAVDIYAIGAILYELVTGEAPFSGNSVFETLRRVAEDEPRRPSLVRSGVDRDLEAIALRCMEKRPEYRYRTAGDVADDLEHFLRGEPIHARPVTWRYRSEKWVLRHRAGVALSALVIVALTGAAGMFESVQRRAALSREGEKIRGVLEESIATNSARASISSYWPSFEADVTRYLGKSRDEHVRQLLRKNVIQVRAEVNSFGLVADPPHVLAEFFCTPAAVGIFARGRLEGSFDGGAWVPLMSATCRSDREPGGFIGPLDLAESFGVAPVEAGPHRVDLRAVVDFCDLHSFAKPPAVSAVRGRIMGRPDGGFSDVAGRKPFATETRILGGRRLHLFEKIPQSFPQRLPAAALKAASFDLRKIRFVVYDFGPADTGCFNVAWETLHGPLELGQTICRPEKLQSTRNLLLIEMAGEFDLASPAPLAGEAKVFLDGGRDSAVTFDLALGGGRYFAGRRPEFSSGVGGGAMRTDSVSVYFHEPVPWARPAERGVSTLLLEPSREVALATGWIDRFVDSPYKRIVPSDVVAAKRNRR